MKSAQFKYLSITYKQGTKNILNYLLRVFDGIKLTPFCLAKPVKLQIEPVSGICNLNCRICDTQSMEKKELLLEEFKKILDMFPFCVELKLTGNGESFMVKDFFKMLEYAKSKNIKVSFYTNMTLVNELIARRLIELNINEIFISIDSSQPDTFERIRKGARYNTVIENINLINKLKAEYDSLYPELYFAVVAMKENIKDIPDLIRLACKLKIKGVVIHHLDIKEAELAVCGQDLKNDPSAPFYFEKAKEIAKKNKLYFNYPSFGLCQLPWINCQIDPWGNVYPCCKLRESFGNISNQNFSEIWNGSKYRMLRRLVLSNKSPCQKCFH